MFFAGGHGLLFAVEGSYGDVCYPLLLVFAEVDAVMAGFVIPPQRKVAKVVSPRAVSQIAPLVVAAVAIDVVDLDRVEAGHDFVSDTVCEIPTVSKPDVAIAIRF